MTEPSTSVGDQTYLTDTASWSEAAITVVGALTLALWGSGHWSARRREVGFYDERAPRWMIGFLQGVFWVIGLLTLACALGWFFPGDVFHVFSVFAPEQAD